MTPSEQLWQEAERRANAPEHMKELLALVIDWGTSALVSEVNQELGQAARYQHACTMRTDGAVYNAYCDQLHQYIQLKLKLHRLRKSCSHPFDSYAERQSIEHVLEQMKSLRQEIKEVRTKARL